LERREDMVSRKRIMEEELESLRRQMRSLDRTSGEQPDYGLGRGAAFVTHWELDQVILRQLEA